MKKILVPIDFSDCSISALHVAADIAKRTQAKISVLNVYDVPAILHPTNLLDPIPMPVARLEDDIRRDILKSTTEKIKSLMSQVHIDQWDWDNQIIVREGNPQSIILEEASKSKYGLVVMGTKGAHTKRIPIMGSVTCNTLRKSMTPVLAVPIHYKSKSRIEKILYATDLKHGEFEALGKLADLANVYHSEITVVHAIDTDKAAASMDLVSKKKEQLSKMVQSIPYPNDLKKSEILYVDDALVGIRDYVKENEIGLICMTTHTQGVLEVMLKKSITRLVVLYSEVPVMAFNDTNVTDFDDEHRKMEPIMADIF